MSIRDGASRVVLASVSVVIAWTLAQAAQMRAGRGRCGDAPRRRLGTVTREEAVRMFGSPPHCVTVS